MRYSLLVALLAVLLSTGCLASKSQAQQANEALSKGLQAHAAGRLDEATKDYREVLKHDPQNKYAFYNLGLIDQTAGQAAAAENNYRLALSIDPNFGAALFNLAIVRANAGATQEAIDLYRRDIAVDPNNAGAHLNLGLLLRASSQQAAGDSEISRAVQLNPRLATPGSPAPAPSPRPSPTP